MGELKNQGEVEVEAIHLWATPRSLSTSLMYSFAQVPIQFLLYSILGTLRKNSKT
jgi:hypothetical protein